MMIEQISLDLSFELKFCLQIELEVNLQDETPPCFFFNSKTTEHANYNSTVVKWVSIIRLFGKKNNATQKIWEFVVPKIFSILINKPSKLAQKNAILCQPDTFVQLLRCALVFQPQKITNVHLGSISVPNQRNPAQTCNFDYHLI